MESGVPCDACMSFAQAGEALQAVRTHCMRQVLTHKQCLLHMAGWHSRPGCMGSLVGIGVHSSCLSTWQSLSLPHMMGGLLGAAQSGLLDLLSEWKLTHTKCSHCVTKLPWDVWASSPAPAAITEFVMGLCFPCTGPSTLQSSADVLLRDQGCSLPSAGSSTSYLRLGLPPSILLI